jgi:pilus assembly protein TadC
VPDVADALVLVALALRAGLPVVESLEQAASVATGAVRRNLLAVAAALRWGRPTGVAWSYAGDVWQPAAGAFQMAESTGAGPADLIEGAAQRLREEEERDRERRAARAGVLLVLPLGLGFLPAFACTAVVPLVVVLADGVLGHR